MRMYNGELPRTLWVVKIGENPTVAYINQFTARHKVLDFVERKIDEAVKQSDDIVRIKELIAQRPYLKRCKGMKELKDVLMTDYFKAMPFGPISMEEVDFDW